jgi:hypothetical protein
MAGDRLVHGVVQHLGGEVVQGVLVGAADIHARAAADRLQPLQNLDVGRGVATGGRLGATFGEEIVHDVFWFPDQRDIGSAGGAGNRRRQAAGHPHTGTFT